ncbi:MAG: hypothetical protein ACREUX_24415 [Burkholderiales bacterium]
MRTNPLVAEVLAGLTRQGKAQLAYLALLTVQAVVLFLWWPKGAMAQVLESQHGPDTLIAGVIAVGATTAYHALRAGAEEFVLPGQHGLRDWALATPLSLGRILRGYVLGQLIHSLHLLALSSPLLLVAFAVSGGEWPALSWCMAAMLVQALFYRLSGALTHLVIGQHPAECHFVVRTILVVVYVPIGWLVPFTSHVAFTTRALGEGVQTPQAFAAVPDHWVFMALYTGLSMFLALVLHLLLLRSRRGMAGPRGGAGEAVAS